MALQRLFVTTDRTVMFNLWTDGEATYATREDSSDIWGPPVTLEEEPVTPMARDENQRTVAVVFDMESDDAPMPLGVCHGVAEDMVLYHNASGNHEAPEDCVKVVRVIV